MHPEIILLLEVALGAVIVWLGQIIAYVIASRRYRDRREFGDSYGAINMSFLDEWDDDHRS